MSTIAMLNTKYIRRELKKDSSATLKPSYLPEIPPRKFKRLMHLTFKVKNIAQLAVPQRI